MKGSRFRATALLLMRLATRVMPDDRVSWGKAMQSELEAIEDPNHAISFAMGCLMTCSKERLFRMELKLNTAQNILLLVLVVLAAITARTSLTFFETHEPTGLIYAGLAVLYLGFAIFAFLKGLKALASAAIPMVVLTLFATALSYAPWATTSEWVKIDLYRALALETVVIWGLVAVTSAFLVKYSNQGTATQD